MKALRSLLDNECGIILVISLLILALLLGGGIGALVSTQTDFKTSANIKTGTQAFYIADAGLHHARQELQDGDGINDFLSIYSAAAGTVIVSNGDFNGGSYTVTREEAKTDAGHSKIKIVSVGSGSNNAVSRIEMWVQRELGRVDHAIVAQNDIEFYDTPKILGSCGTAHANDNIDVFDGSAAVEKANGLRSRDPLDIHSAATPCVGSAACAESPPPEQYVIDTAEERAVYEENNSGAPSYSIPGISARDYAPLVAAMGSEGNHYILHSDGKVTLGGTCSDGYCSEGAEVSPPTGWSFVTGTEDQWVLSGTTAANGVFYSEIEVKIGGSPGTDENPWQATIISRNDIRLTSGSGPKMEPYKETSRELKNHLFVADDDIRINGNLRADYRPGVILARDEFTLEGNAKLKGFIVSRGSGADNKVKDNAQITYNCDVGCAGPGCPSSTTYSTVGWAQRF